MHVGMQQKAARTLLARARKREWGRQLGHVKNKQELEREGECLASTGLGVISVCRGHAATWSAGLRLAAHGKAKEPAGQCITRRKEEREARGAW